MWTRKPLVPGGGRLSQTQPGRESVQTNTAVFRMRWCLGLFFQYLCFEKSFLP